MPPKERRLTGPETMEKIDSDHLRDQIGIALKAAGYEFEMVEAGRRFGTVFRIQYGKTHVEQATIQSVVVNGMLDVALNGFDVVDYRLPGLGFSKSNAATIAQVMREKLQESHRALNDARPSSPGTSVIPPHVTEMLVFSMLGTMREARDYMSDSGTMRLHRSEAVSHAEKLVATANFLLEEGTGEREWEETLREEVEALNDFVASSPEPGNPSPIPTYR